MSDASRAPRNLWRTVDDAGTATRRARRTVSRETGGSPHARRRRSIPRSYAGSTPRHPSDHRGSRETCELDEACGRPSHTPIAHLQPRPDPSFRTQELPKQGAAADRPATQTISVYQESRAEPIQQAAREAAKKRGKEGGKKTRKRDAEARRGKETWKTDAGKRRGRETRERDAGKRRGK